MALMTIWVIVAERLPVWAVGAYGNEWSSTPHLDEFASRSVVFHQHIADTPRQLSPDSLSPWYPWCPGTPRLDFAPIHWVQGPDLTWPVTEIDFDEWMRMATEAITEFDDWLGNWLRQADLRNDWIILTSGQGVPLAKLPWWTRESGSIHESIAHLPLVIHLPHDEQAGRVVLELTQPVDLAQTLVEFIKGVPDVAGHGKSLLPLMREKATCRPYAVLASADRRTWALQTRDEKIVLQTGETGDTEKVQYYVKPDDRWEVNDLRHVHFDRAEQLVAILNQVVNLTQNPSPIEYPQIPEEENGDGHREVGARGHDGPEN